MRNQARKRNKRHSDCKQRSKIVPADDMILYIHNSEASIKQTVRTNTTKLIVSGYKIDIQKSIVFLYTHNELSEEEILKIPCAIESKTIKYLGRNLTKKIKDLYAKKYKILMKEVGENTNK